MFDLELFGELNINRKSELIGSEIYENYTKYLNEYILRLSRWNHFIDYPAQYYSYVLAHILSKKIWKKSFQSNHDIQSLSLWKKQIRQSGKLYREYLTQNPKQLFNEFNS
jgi:Zn-dependent oligopeptidase